MRVAVIGAGASGLMAAGFCAQNGHHVDLFEANEKVGKKIFITGKGRCNVTNACEPAEVIGNIVNNPKFLFSALNSFTSQDTIDFFENLGVELKIERGNRVFPVSDKSSDIIKALERFAVQNGVNIRLNHKVQNVEKNGDFFSITTNCGIYNTYNCAICCTGGATYSATGSTGDGYGFAKKFNHNISEINPALVPIILNDTYIKDIEGLSLKNVKLVAMTNGKFYKDFFGEMLFTSKGISGPIALSMSSYINKCANVSLYIDFKPALSCEQVLSRLDRDIVSFAEKQVNTMMYGLLPKAIVPHFLKKISIDEVKKVKSLNSKQISLIANTLKRFDLSYKSLDKLDFGIITSGGVKVSEINPKTMESKLVSGLYFAGEVIDVDALTGGFNLQIAFATGYVAGNSI